jgi:hypothetical protein
MSRPAVDDHAVSIPADSHVDLVHTVTLVHADIEVRNGLTGIQHGRSLHRVHDNVVQYTTVAT